jgi:hypothetical protein
MSLYGSILYGSGVFYTGSGIDKPASLNFYRITGSDNLYTFYWNFNQLFQGPIIPSFDYQLQISLDIDFTSPTVFETTSEVAQVLTQGYSQSKVYAATNIAAGLTLILNIDGDGPQSISLALNSTGAAIAADIQTKVQALTANNPGNQLSFNNFTATFNSVLNQYKLISGGTGVTSTVVVLKVTPAY